MLYLQHILYLIPISKQKGQWLAVSWCKIHVILTEIQMQNQLRVIKLSVNLIPLNFILFLLHHFVRDNLFFLCLIIIYSYTDVAVEL
jgi:hypothetical protein